jgi:hypothetical protein
MIDLIDLPFKTVHVMTNSIALASSMQTLAKARRNVREYKLA